MKIVRLLFVLPLTFFLAANLFAQIPNNSFENWTNGNPDGWFTDNIFTFTPVTQSSDAQSGSSAAKLEVIDIGGGTALLPTLVSGDTGQGFPISERYGALSGYFKFSPVNSNTYFQVVIAINRSDTAIGGGVYSATTAANSYTQFTAPIIYFGSGNPDNCIIGIYIYDSTNVNASIGSIALVDNLSFGPVTAVQPGNNVVKNFALNQNYPNPFNPTTKISYIIPKESFVNLKIYNILGMEVATLVNQRESAGSYNINFNGSNLPSGIYLARLTTADYTKTIKMTLLK